jgi:hypothetical protein
MYWQGMNAFRVRCRACGRLLKANTVTWMWLMGCIGIATAVFIFLFANIGKVAVGGAPLKVCLFLLVGGCALMAWFTGGYVAADDEPEQPGQRSDQQAPDAQE